MMQYIATFKNITICFCLCLSFSALTDEIIWKKNQNVLIKVVSQDSKDYSHPMQISNDTLKIFLSQILLSDQTTGKSQELFNEQQITLLAEQLPIAFTKANSNQVIVFSLDQKISSFGGILTTEVFTAGAFYISQNNLTVVIGDLYKERERGFESVYDPTKLGLVRYDFDYGLDKPPSLKVNTKLSFSTKLSSIFGAQTNQLSITLDALTKLQQEAQKQENINKNSNIPSLTRQEVEKMIDERNIKSSTTQKSLPILKPSKNNEIEERFKLLESLYEQGLITQDEYQAKRKEILTDI